MKPMATHLTEDERHAFADDALSPDEHATAEAHVAICQSCATDVARITTLMKRIHDAPAPTAPLDDLWPSIRARIEQTKVVPLATDAAGAPLPGSRFPLPAGRRARWSASIGVVAAAAIIVFAVRGRRPDAGNSSAGVDNTNAAFIAVVDSAHAYEQEARTLLDKLELQRAMLRPDAAKALDRDLHVIDVAIAELKDAVARDPNNPALRQLLATSYRQKVDLLKRIANAS
jgi:anti-sigma factor RsiW